MPHRLLVTIFLGLMAALCLTTAVFATPITVLPDITAWATTASDKPQAIHASPVSAAAPYQALHAWADRPVVQCDVPSNNYATIQMAVDDVACDIVNLIGAQYLEHDITISRTLTLQGQGTSRTILDAGGVGGISITGTLYGPVVIQNLTITGATSSAIFYDASGQEGYLWLEKVRFKGNGGPGIIGGALSSFGSRIFIRHCQFINNSASVFGGGGAIFVEAVKTLDIQGSLFQGNSAYLGGAIFNSGSSVSIKNSRFVNNTSPGQGGALYNNGGWTTIEQSVFSNNRAIGDGGAIYSEEGLLSIKSSTLVKNSARFGDGGSISASRVSLLDIRDSAISQNSATVCGGIGINDTQVKIVRSAITYNTAGLFGGGLCLWSESGQEPQETEITNSTVSHNTAAQGAGLYLYQLNPPSIVLTANYTTIAFNSASEAGGGLYGAENSLVQLNHSIIWGNGGNDCVFSQGDLTSMGYNIDGDNSCLLTDPTDLPATDPLLGPLQNNGGPTETHALSVGSPALDAIPSDACLATDQRGVARPQGPGCDIGAFELEP